MWLRNCFVCSTTVQSLILTTPSCFKPIIQELKKESRVEVSIDKLGWFCWTWTVRLNTVFAWTDTVRSELLADGKRLPHSRVNTWISTVVQDSVILQIQRGSRQREAWWSFAKNIQRSTSKLLRAICSFLSNVHIRNYAMHHDQVGWKIGKGVLTMKKEANIGLRYPFTRKIFLSVRNQRGTQYIGQNWEMFPSTLLMKSTLIFRGIPLGQELRQFALDHWPLHMKHSKMMEKLVQIKTFPINCD